MSPCQIDKYVVSKALLKLSFFTNETEHRITMERLKLDFTYISDRNVIDLQVLLGMSCEKIFKARYVH